uniref:Uncharacterized protein n=1 Tax=Nothobranchius pienaari TaxID=704102 RepID=A0A1A8N8N4_9TELE
MTRGVAYGDSIRLGCTRKVCASAKRPITSLQTAPAALDFIRVMVKGSREELHAAGSAKHHKIPGILLQIGPVKG